MLYFIQLTPWSNLQHRHLKDHWGLLPTFDLDTPGNVEAWNKLRLYAALLRARALSLATDPNCLTLVLSIYCPLHRYLQSAQIKSSRYKQVSVLWCFFAVVLIAIVKIIEMVRVESQRVEAAECSKYFDSDAEQQCNQLDGCQWLPDPTAPINQTDSLTVLPSVVVTSDGNEYTCAESAGPADGLGTNRCQRIICEDILAVSNCTLKATNQWCSWNLGHQQCEREEQHFDTMSLFVVVETLIFGSGLIYTLWEGMKSNEIKKEAFPYVVRMKYSELLVRTSLATCALSFSCFDWLNIALFDTQLQSNAMSFVSERAYWEKHKRSWREAEVKLLAIVRKLKSVKNAATSSATAADEAHAIPGTTRNQQLQLLLTKSKDRAVEKLEEQGFYSFVSSDSRASDTDRSVQRTLAKQLQEARIVTGPDEAERYAADLVNEGCTTFELLKDLVRVNEVGSDAALGRDDQLSQSQSQWSPATPGIIESNADGSSVPVPELSAARYPFGSAPNRTFPNPAKVHFERLNNAQLDLGESHREAAISEDDDGVSETPSTDLVRLRSELAAARKELEEKNLALQHANVQIKAEAERDRCMRMLKVLADTLDEEYSEGGRAHWGSEDRRTKMWFINLNRPLLGKLILAIFGQVVVAGVGILLKYLGGD